MSRAILRFFTTAVLLLSFQTGAYSAPVPQMSPEVRAWFVALTKVNHPHFKKLIAEGTEIRLKDLGIVQTREEFLNSLDAWEEATKGAIILTQMISSENGKDVVEVCYRFPDNEQLNRETYHYSDGLITAVTQERIGNECKGF